MFFWQKNVFFNFPPNFWPKIDIFGPKWAKKALLGGTSKIAIFSHFCWFIATHQTIHHTMRYFTIWKACQKVAHALYFVPIYKFIGLQWTWKAVSPLKEAQYQQNWAKMPLQPFSQGKTTKKSKNEMWAKKCKKITFPLLKSKIRSDTPPQDFAWTFQISEE